MSLTNRPISLMVIYHVMSEGTPEEVLQKIFKVFDLNLDGTINKKEMGRLVRDMYALIRHDDPEAASMEAIASSAFIEMDKDVDGKITVEEFTRGKTVILYYILKEKLSIGMICLNLFKFSFRR